MNNPRIGLALGSGSARGWAHIGVLRALHEAGIQPDSTIGKLNGVRRSMQGPGLFDVMASAINIMQHNISKSRMAGDPPDIILTPRLAHIGLLEFDRATECMQQGRDSVTRKLADIKHAIAA